MEGVIQAVSTNPWLLVIAVVVVLIGIAVAQTFAAYDVLAPIQQIGGMAVVLALTVAAYFYGGWIGLGVLALLIVLK